MLRRDYYIKHWKECMKKGGSLNRQELKALRNHNIIAHVEYEYLSSLKGYVPDESYKMQKDLLVRITHSHQPIQDSDLFAGAGFVSEDV